MKDEEILDVLRRERARRTATQLADLLEQLTGEKVSQTAMVMYFKRALPNIPLGVLLEAGAWNRVSNGGLSDAGFDEMLRPWLANDEPAAE